MTESQRGLLFGVSAYLAWGLSPIYWRWLSAFDPFALVGYRVVWSLPLLALVITLRGGWPSLRKTIAKSGLM